MSNTTESPEFPATRDLLRLGAAARRLGISSLTLSKLALNGTVPYYGIAGSTHRRFLVSDLDEIRAAGRRPRSIATLADLAPGQR